MFLHPLCPCSRASIEELNRLMVLIGDRVQAQVIFVCSNATLTRESSDLEVTARGIPGLNVVNDLGGTKARSFGASTSGATVLYSSSGALLFCGGITGARGHAGDNVGASMLSAAVQSGIAAPARAPVFGCALLDPPAPTELENPSCHR